MTPEEEYQSALQNLTESLGTCSVCGLKWEAMKPPADSPVYAPEKVAYRKWREAMLPDLPGGPVRIVHCGCDAELIRPARVVH